MPSDFLNLPNLKTLDVSEKDGQYQVMAESTEKHVHCNICCCDRHYKFGVRPLPYVDLPNHGKPVTIHIDRQRYQCRNIERGCRAVSLHPLSDMSDEHQMTTRLVKYIETKGLEVTFAQVARDTGLDESTIRRVVAAYIKRLEDDHKYETPRWLGLDEIFILKRARGVIANVEDNCMVDMLENRNKTTVGTYINTRLDRSKIEVVTMDMWNPYRDVAKDLLPKAMVVVDRFHIQRMATAAMETIRKSFRQELNKHTRLKLKNDRFILLRRARDLDDWQKMKLEEWSKEFPTLGQAWVAKESFFDIWTCHTTKEARECYKIWLKQLPESMEEAFSDLTRAMRNWESEIFHYFETRATNAYTEALNGIIRVINRTGRGYSFEVLRAKMLFAHGRQRQKQTRIIRTRPDFGRMEGAYMMLEQAPEIIELGVPFSVIAEMIENGEI